jgi:UDP-N-acetylmuramoyl-L-alanyl-D-glutamate--2,6-diaminopimelate ligase
MQLSNLLASLDHVHATGDPEVDISGVAYHSQAVKPGDLFVAIRGVRSDGHAFLREAVARGAQAVVVEEGLPGDVAIPVVVVPDARKALADISSSFFGNPSRQMTLVGITGTNGKTTTSYLVESILKATGRMVGVVGTVNYRMADTQLPAATTTPQSYDLQRLLRAMVDTGVTHAVIEVSSHALHQERVRGCGFDVGIFTNVSPEHLDYHADMEEYFRAKCHLFHEILPRSGKNSIAVLNIDDPRLRSLLDALPSQQLLTYGLKRGDIRTLDREVSLYGLRATIETPAGVVTIHSPLIGEYNLYNIMAAAAACLALNVPLAAVQHGIEEVTHVPGRMERIGSGTPVILVDYAHTPDALEKALTAVRALIQGRLLVVFGCGGDRDRTKRPRMGQLGTELADIAIITSDNPRSEDPLHIIEDILSGINGDASGHYHIIPDRREAIQRAVAMATHDDVVLIAGKGHEDYQIIGDRRDHFDDREEAHKALASIGAMV